MSEQAPNKSRGRPRKKLENISQKPSNLKVHIFPSFGDHDAGDGGIRRVVEGQLKHLPKFGIDIVKTAEEADVIACHAVIPNNYVKLFPRKAIVALCHGMYWDDYQWENWALKANAEVMENMRISDTIITCSEWVANSVRRNLSRPTYVIPHGIDIEEWNIVESPKDYVLWNKTRPDPVCDPTPMNQVAEILPQIKFISTYGKEAPNVALTGTLEFSKAKQLIQNAGAYLCTTRETFGIGTLEALACGVPVVGYDFGGQREFIEQEVDGWLVNPGDIDNLARGINWALQNRENLAETCRAKAAQFTWEKAAEMYANVFIETFERKQISAPRTSIIVTNYNLEKYLPDCLESIKNQSDQDWECIIVDDASSSKEGIKIAEHYSELDHRFKFIINEKNVYLAEARNIGIRKASGRYILSLDADDMLDHEAIKILADSLDNDRTIHVAYGNVRFTEEDGTTLSDYSQWGGQSPGHSGWPFPFTFEQQIIQRNLLPYCSMFRKEAWLFTGGYRRRCKTAEDADFWTRLSSYGFRPKMVSNHDTLVYRNREGSMSRENAPVEWAAWFPWSKNPGLTPAGAVTKNQLPIPNYDPIVISVVIPVGPGHDKIFTDAVDSVDSQTFRNWECIVVNDTGEPLKTELPAWVRIIETSGVTGTAHARNVGIEASHGKLFLPLDADDYLEPEALDIMFNAFLIEKDIIYSDFWQTSPDGKELSIHNCDNYDPRLLNGRKRTFEGQVREGMIHSATILCPKSVWEKVGGYDETLPAWEDWDFQLAVGDIGQCSRRVAMPLFVYRKHTGFRREENYEFFHRSKEALTRKWGKLWDGGYEIMACRTCGSKATVLPQNGWANASVPKAVSQNDDAILVKYKGNKLGAINYRGPSRTMYSFGSGDMKYVLRQDIDMFKNKIDFEIIERPSDQIEYPDNMPVLTAPGQA